MGNRLFVGNLSFHTTEDSLLAAFAPHGEVASVKLMLDRDTGRSRGFAFVDMKDAAMILTSACLTNVVDPG